MPIHNAGAALAHSVERLLAQALADTEIIVVDDASTDGSVDALVDRPNTRVRSIRLHENGGPAAARNAGARAASSPWLMFLDGDDHLLPGALEQFLQSIPDAHDGLVRAGVHWHLDDGAIAEVEAFTPGSFVVRADLFWAVGGYDPELRFGENSDLIERLERRIRESGGTIAHLEQATVLASSFAESRDYNRARMESAIHLLERDAARLNANPRRRSRYEMIAAVNATRVGEYGPARVHAWRSVRAEPKRLSNYARLALVCSGPFGRWYWTRNDRVAS